MAWQQIEVDNANEVLGTEDRKTLIRAEFSLRNRNHRITVDKIAVDEEYSATFHAILNWEDVTTGETVRKCPVTIDTRYNRDQEVMLYREFAADVNRVETFPVDYVEELVEFEKDEDKRIELKQWLAAIHDAHFGVMGIAA